MTNVGVINAKHFKNVRATIRTTKGRPNLLEEVRKMA
jgi:hypothetical protein